MTDIERQQEDEQRARMVEVKPPRVGFNHVCPSCKNKLRAGIEVAPGGKASFVVWCHRPQCDGCRGDAQTLNEAADNLIANYERRSKRH
jgi:hypothetical protein